MGAIILVLSNTTWTEINITGLTYSIGIHWFVFRTDTLTINHFSWVIRTSVTLEGTPCTNFAPLHQAVRTVAEKVDGLDMFGTNTFSILYLHQGINALLTCRTWIFRTSTTSSNLALVAISVFIQFSALRTWTYSILEICGFIKANGAGEIFAFFAGSATSNVAGLTHSVYIVWFIIFIMAGAFSSL